MPGSSEGSQINTGSEDIACGSAVLPMVTAGFEIEISDYEAEHAALPSRYFWQVVEIVIRGVLTVVEVGFICVFISLSRILLQFSLSTNLFGPIQHHVDIWIVQVGIKMHEYNYPMAEIIPPGVHFARFLGRNLSFSICFFVYLSLVQKFRSEGIGCGVGHFAGSPDEEYIFEGVKTMQGMWNAAQCCIIVRIISSIHIEV
jgi:hypothetical protein